MKSFLLLFLFCCTLKGAGLGVYNPAQHAVNGFMPTQLPDLQLWLDASKLPFTNGTAVDVWQDFSGKSNWATNGTGSKQPTITTLNGRTALSFDGVDDGLAIKDYKTQTYISFFAVLKMQSATAKHFVFEQSIDANINSGFYFYGSEKGPWSFNRNGAQNYADGVANWSGTNFIVVNVLYNGSGVYQKNGVTQANNTINGSARANSVVTDILNIMAIARGATGVYAEGKLCEVVAYTNRLSDASVKVVQRYLGTKYGIVVQ